MPRPLHFLKWPVIHCTEGWKGPRAFLDTRGKCRSHQDSNSGPSARSESLYRLCYLGHAGLLVAAERTPFWLESRGGLESSSFMYPVDIAVQLMLSRFVLKSLKNAKLYLYEIVYIIRLKMFDHLKKQEERGNI
jgi:hypothetical protein